MATNIEKKAGLTMEIVDIDDPPTVNAVKALAWEYFQWGNGVSIARHGFDFDIAQMMDEFVQDLDRYRRPGGVMRLLKKGDLPIGTGGYKKAGEGCCELKRIFIQERFRRRGLGTSLLNCLIDDARRDGFLEMKLESARFMEDAERLYRRFGFEEIPIYFGVESPEKFQSIIYCMKRSLVP